MKIFLDTNILIGIIDNKIELPSRHHYCTFEKCVYELKNGYKQKLYNANFLSALLTALIDDNNKTINNLYDEKLIDFFKSRLSHLQYSVEEIRKVKKILKKYILRFEYGIASEYEFVNLPRNSDIELLKTFFKYLKISLRTIFSELENNLKKYRIEELLYEQIFGLDLSMSNFREILDDSVINPKDLEIVFAALKSNCNVFLSADNQLIRETFTLGLNHIVHFRYIDINKNELKSEIKKQLDWIEKSY